VRRIRLTVLKTKTLSVANRVLTGDSPKEEWEECIQEPEESDEWEQDGYHEYYEYEEDESSGYEVCDLGPEADYKMDT
jgi:hypothetical protein